MEGRGCGQDNASKSIDMPGGLVHSRKRWMFSLKHKSGISEISTQLQELPMHMHMCQGLESLPFRMVSHLEHPEIKANVDAMQFTL